MTSPQTPIVCRLFVPAYNEAARIVRCLESVKTSSLPSGFEWAEWAVHDDDSTDDTAQLAESWAANRPLIPLRVVRAPRRSGKAAALGAYRADLIAQGLLSHLVVVLDADLAVAPRGAWVPARRFRSGSFAWRGMGNVSDRFPTRRPLGLGLPNGCVGGSGPQTWAQRAASLRAVLRLPGGCSGGLLLAGWIDRRRHPAGGIRARALGPGPDRGGGPGAGDPGGQ